MAMKRQLQGIALVTVIIINLAAIAAIIMLSGTGAGLINLAAWVVGFGLCPLGIMCLLGVE